MKSLFFIFLAISSVIQAADTFPTCPRPTSLSEKGALKKLEACTAAQKKFCSTHEKIPACAKFTKGIPGQVKIEKDPHRDCAILSNGFYRCTPEPVRFVEKTQMPQPSIPKIEESISEGTKPKTSEQNVPGPEGTFAIPPPPPASPAPAPNK